MEPQRFMWPDGPTNPFEWTLFFMFVFALGLVWGKLGHREVAIVCLVGGILGVVISVGYLLLGGH